MLGRLLIGILLAVSAGALAAGRAEPRLLDIQKPSSVAEAHGRAPDSTPVLSIDEYRGELERCERELEKVAARPQAAVAFRDSLPPAWVVVVPAAKATVSTEFLRAGLTDYLRATASHKTGLLRQLRDRLTAMEEEAAGFQQPSPADAAMRSRLDRILAAREFRGLQGPSALEILKQQIGAWLRRLLEKIGPVPHAGEAGLIFVWLMIAASACVLAIWLFRLAKRDRLESLFGAPGSPQRAAKSWADWMAEARAQAARDNWREAIRFGYWAALSYLESIGLCAPDRARTPRDWLRALPSGSPRQPAFAALTRRFEAVWYGNRAAGAPEFDEMLAQLEELGCLANPTATSS